MWTCLILLLTLCTTTSSSYIRPRKTQELPECYKSTHYPTYTNMIYLKGSNTNTKYDLTFHYRLNRDSTFSGLLEYVGKGYLSLGVSPDGQMVPGTAIVGLPGQDSSPGVYSMTAQSVAGVALSSNQNLIDGVITQDDKFTNLTFTAPLEISDGDSILYSGNNYFMYAVGIINNLSMHRFRESFVVDFQNICIGMENIFNTTSDYGFFIDPVKESAVVEEASVGVTEDVSAAEQTVEETETEESASAQDIFKAAKSTCSGNSDNAAYTHKLSLDDNLLFYYKLNKNEETLSAQLQYKGKGYVSWAIAPTGTMVYSEAVIGVPNQPISTSNPGKYALTSLQTSGVNLMPSQTLVNSSITQDDTTTTLSFTKLLNEENELSINPNGVNTFTWAVGGGNNLGYHVKRSSFVIDLSKTCADAHPAYAISLNKRQPVSLAYWKAHGFFAGFSWAFLTPFAIMSSWYRDLLEGSLWMKLHLYLNLASAFFTFLAFILAVVAISKSGGQHFINTHQKIGLAMFILVFIQTLNGYFRPARNPVKQKYKRRIWEKVHKLIGYFLFVASIWEVQEGLKLYAVRSGKDFTLFFWGWVTALAVINFLMFFYIYIYHGVILQDAISADSFKKSLAVLGPRFTSSVKYNDDGNLVASEDS